MDLMIVLELASEYHIFSILEGGLAAAAVLISFGAVIGKHHTYNLCWFSQQIYPRLRETATPLQEAISRSLISI